MAQAEILLRTLDYVYLIGVGPSCDVRVGIPILEGHNLDLGQICSSFPWVPHGISPTVGKHFNSSLR